MYQYIMFDLDGTLIRSGDGIIDSAVYTLNKLGIEFNGRDELRKFIGPPLFNSFKDFYDMTDEEADRAVEIYRTYYEAEGVMKTPLYDGIKDVLKNLKELGKSLLVVTSKPLVLAESIIEKEGITGYFDDIVGPLREEKTIDKAELIKRAFERNGIEDTASAVMIGDRKFDIEAAAKNNTASIGVLYGYGSREEFETAGATYIVNESYEIPEIV